MLTNQARIFFLVHAYQVFVLQELFPPSALKSVFVGPSLAMQSEAATNMKGATHLVPFATQQMEVAQICRAI